MAVSRPVARGKVVQPPPTKWTISSTSPSPRRTCSNVERGAITPFGATRAWPVVVDESAAGRDRVALGGGAHGVNLHLAPADLVTALAAEVVDVTVPEVSPDTGG